MENCPHLVTTQKHTYSFYGGQKQNGSVREGKQVFMVSYGQIVAHLNDMYGPRQHLVYCNLSGQKVECFLKAQSSVEQLSKYEFIVFNLTDFSVDKITLVNKQWKIDNIRAPQNVESKSRSETPPKLYLFKQTNSFCIVEQSPIKLPKIAYYRQAGEHFWTCDERTVKSSAPLFKINEKGVLGWVQNRLAQKRGNCRNFYSFNQVIQRRILHRIVLESNNSSFVEEELQIHWYKEDIPTFGWWFHQLRILRMVELAQDLYICSSNKFGILKFWLYDIRNARPCLKSIYHNGEHNLRLFQYDNYRFKSFGLFDVLTSKEYADQRQKEYYQSYTSINPEKSVRITEYESAIKHHSKVCIYSYKWAYSFPRLMNSELKFTVTTQANLKDIYMDMLLHINEDFDDDLLQDSIELIVD